MRKLEVLENSEGRISQSNIIQTWRIIKMQVPQAILGKGYTLNDINYLVKEAFEGLGCIIQIKITLRMSILHLCMKAG